MASQTMKAINYVGPHKVAVEDVPKPKLEHADDIIVKVTTVSPVLHDTMYLGRNLRRLIFS